MRRHAPMLLPAAALAAGSLLAFELTRIPRLPWGALALLGTLLALAGRAWRRRAGLGLAFLAVGVLAATVRFGLPADPLAGFDRGRPVEALVRVTGHWAADPDEAPRALSDSGWSASARLLRLRQGGVETAPPLDLSLHLPDADAPPPYGSSLWVRGYLSRSHGFANRAAVPPGPWRLRVKSRLLMAVAAPPGPLAALSGALRRRVDSALFAAGPESAGKRQGKALARALVLGDSSGLPLAWKRGLRIAGVVHLIVVSGLHIALLAGAVWLLAAWLPRRARLLLILAALALYLLLVGPLPPLVRSAVMGALGVGALLLERPPAAANAFGWAVALLVLADPGVVREASFQLTAAATAGLLVLAPPLARRWRRRLPSALAAPLAASAAAQTATLPWALPLFHTLAPSAPLLNLVAVPWTGLALAGSLLWTAAALVSPRLAALLLPALDLVAAPFGWLAHLRPRPWLTLPLLLSPPAAWGLAAALALLLLARPRRAWLRAAALAAGLLLAGACLWRPLARGEERGPELAMLDVGQGDAILLRDGARAVLVDGGGWRQGDLGGRVLLPALLAEGVHHLDALVMTHPDLDHCGGLVDIAAYLPVEAVWTGPGWEDKGCAGQLFDLPGVRVRFLATGERLAVGRWRLTVLHPDPGPRETVGINARSLILRAEAFGRSVLLTGDAEREAEEETLACCAARLRADVLKVGHHGSRTSTAEPFLEAVAPRLALVSLGIDNLYHHPSPTVIARLRAHGIRILRTDRVGQIVLRFRADGRTHLELPGVPR